MVFIIGSAFTLLEQGGHYWVIKASSCGDGVVFPTIADAVGVKNNLRGNPDTMLYISSSISYVVYNKILNALCL